MTIKFHRVTGEPTLRSLGLSPRALGTNPRVMAGGGYAAAFCWCARFQPSQSGFFRWKIV